MEQLSLLMIGQSSSRIRNSRFKEGHYYLVNFTAETDGQERSNAYCEFRRYSAFLIVARRLMSHRRVSQFYESAILLGRLVRDPELRMCKWYVGMQFTLAIDRRFKNQYGERPTDFIPCW